MPKPVHLPIAKPKNVLVLCHGNICRSPLAGAVLSRELGAARVRSRGLKDHPKGPAAKKVRDFATGIGIDLSQHRAAAVTKDDLAWADVVLYMDQANLRRLEAWQLGAEREVACLGSYIGEARVPDPNYLPRGPELDQVLKMVVRAAEACARVLKSKTPGNRQGLA